MSDIEQPLETPQEENTCRICLEPGELLQPCDCKTSYVHKECLLKWLETSGRTNCEICLFEYKIELSKRPTPQKLLFSDDPILNRNIKILGFFVLIPFAPFAFYMGFRALDVYYAINVIFILLVFAYIKHVKILATLGFWKTCLTTGYTVVAVETGSYDHFFFDYGISAIFAILACFCNDTFLRPINNEENSENE